MNSNNIFIIDDYNYFKNNDKDEIFILNTICKLKTLPIDNEYNLFIIDKIIDSDGVIDNEIMIEEIINTIEIKLIVFKGDSKSLNTLDKICKNYKINLINI